MRHPQATSTRSPTYLAYTGMIPQAAASTRSPITAPEELRHTPLPPNILILNSTITLLALWKREGVLAIPLLVIRD